MNQHLVLILLVALFTVHTHGDDNKAKWEQNKKECLKEVGVEESSFDEKKVPDCFYKCMKIKGGMMDDSGAILVEKIKAKYPNSPMVANLETCSKSEEVTSKTNPCAKAKTLTVCMGKNWKKN